MIKVNLNADIPISENTVITCTQCGEKIRGEKARKTISFQVNQTPVQDGPSVNEFTYIGDDVKSSEVHETILCQECVNRLNWTKFYKNQIEPKQKRHVLSDYHSREFAYGFAVRHKVFGGEKLTEDQEKLLEKELYEHYKERGIERYNITKIIQDTKTLLER